MFGPYRLDGLLGHGPSAAVYRAVDSSHGNRVVALKVSPQLSADAGFRERFRRDASVLGALREPRIVPIHRYGELVIHDLTTGERLGAPLTGHEAAVTTLGVTHLRGTPILVSAARDNANRVWDLAVRAAS